MEPLELLVDSHHGIYCWQRLVEMYDAPEYNLKFSQLPDEAENYHRLFDPLNEQYCENIDWFCDDVEITLGGLVYRVEQLDGDIFAIHPNAEWSEYLQEYRLVHPDEIRLTVPSHFIYWLVYGMEGGQITDEEDRLFKSFVDGRTRLGKALNRGQYDIISEDYFSWWNDIPNYNLGSNVCDIAVLPLTNKKGA